VPSLCVANEILPANILREGLNADGFAIVPILEFCKRNKDARDSEEGRGEVDGCGVAGTRLSVEPVILGSVRSYHCLCSVLSLISESKY
jgi:hypothetical protein